MEMRSIWQFFRIRYKPAWLSENQVGHSIRLLSYSKPDFLISTLGMLQNHADSGREVCHTTIIRVIHAIWGLGLGLGLGLDLGLGNGSINLTLSARDPKPAIFTTFFGYFLKIFCEQMSLWRMHGGGDINRLWESQKWYKFSESPEMVFSIEIGISLNL